MKKRSFERLLSQIEKLTPAQSKQLKNTLKQQYSEKQLAIISKEMDHCPHCGTTSIYKWGTRSKLQRYKCRECNKR